MLCPECGNEVSPSAGFCTYCGVKLTHVQPPHPPVKSGTSSINIVLIVVAIGFIAVVVLGILIAIAVPGFLRARENSRGLTCQENLTKIDGAKEQWALEMRMTDGTELNNKAFLNDPNIFGSSGYVRRAPICPSGGKYTVNAIGEDPTCSIGLSNAPFTPHILPGSSTSSYYSPKPKKSSRSEKVQGHQCRVNLAKIDGAKEQWALEMKMTNGTELDSDAFLNDNNIFGSNGYVKKRPVCPSGGKYTLNAIGEDPTCSIGVSEDPPHVIPEM